MIALARRWFNFVADLHDAQAQAHARRRDRALRQLERGERAELRRDAQRQIDSILERTRHAPGVRDLAELTRLARITNSEERPGA